MTLLTRVSGDLNVHSHQQRRVNVSSSICPQKSKLWRSRSISLASNPSLCHKPHELFGPGIYRYVYFMRPIWSLIQDSILLGLVSDLAKNKYDMPRSYSLVLVSFFFFISQVVAANEDRIENLWIASTLLGLAHGSVFSLFPTVCMEWFGMRKNYFCPLFFFFVVI